MSSVTARWNANGNAGGTTYRIQFATSTDFTSSNVTLVEVTTTALAISSSVPSNWSVAFRVKSEGATPSSYVASVATVTLPAAPSLNSPNFAVSDVGVSSVTARWNANGNVSGTNYRIQFATSADFTSSNDAVEVRQPRWRYRRACRQLEHSVPQSETNNLASSYAASVATVTLPASPSLNTPNFTASDVGVSSVTARWNANGNVGGTIYRVQFATSADFTSSGVTLVEVTTTALTVSSATPSSWTIAFRVRGENANGLVSSYTASASTATLPASPSLNTPNFAVTDVGVSSVTARWNANGNAGGAAYRVQFATSTDFTSSNVTLVEVTTTALAVSSGVPSN